MSKSILSECCSREVTKSTKHDPHPLGRGEYNGVGIFQTIGVCTGCGKECEYEEVQICECCGEQEERLIDTRLGQWCMICVVDFGDKLMERVTG